MAEGEAGGRRSTQAVRPRPGQAEGVGLASAGQEPPRTPADTDPYSGGSPRLPSTR